jgi:hypothetical protein
MALPLHIPPCIHSPAAAHHPPPDEKPLRIQIEGPLTAVKKLLPEVPWRTDMMAGPLVFPQPAGPELAGLAYQSVYGRNPHPEVAGDLVVRDEYLGWLAKVKPPRFVNLPSSSIISCCSHRDIILHHPFSQTLRHIDYYGVTFDHLVPEGDIDPEVLQINIIETAEDDGAYANEGLLFSVDAAEYTGQKVLAVPRCCQKRKGTQDRGRVNDGVNYRVTGIRD